jgi:hypothetical protein
MPRISFRDYLPPGHRPWYEHVVDAGNAIAGGIAGYRREKRADAAAQAEAEEQAARDEREFAIEETRAKASLLAESNRATLIKAKADEDAAEKLGYIERLQERAGNDMRDRVSLGVKKALGSPGGVLGPFGLLGRVVGGAAGGAAQSAAKWGPKVALAKRMSADGARRYLEDEAELAKGAVLGEGFQEDSRAVLNGVADGVLTPEAGQGLVNDLARALRTGGSPGAVSAEVTKAYDEHAKAVARAQSWVDTDRKAGELFVTLDDLAGKAESPSAAKALRTMAATARSEWARTQVDTYRNDQGKPDGPTALAALEGLVWRAQAVAEEPLTGPQYSPRPFQEIQALEEPISYSHRFEEVPLDPQVPPGGRQAKAPRGTPQAPGEAPQPARPPTAIRPAGKLPAAKAVDAHVARHGRAVIEQGADPKASKAAVAKMRAALAKELELDPLDPALEGFIIDALRRLQRGELPFNEPPKKRGPTMGESLSRLRPGAGGM